MNKEGLIAYLVARHCGNVYVMHAIRLACSAVYRRTEELVDVYLEKRELRHFTVYYLGNQRHNHRGQPAEISSNGKREWYTYGQQGDRRRLALY